MKACPIRDMPVVQWSRCPASNLVIQGSILALPEDFHICKYSSKIFIIVSIVLIKSIWKYILLRSNPFWNIAGTTAASAQVGFMLTYQHKCNIAAEITVSNFYSKNKKFKLKKRVRRNIILATLRGPYQCCIYVDMST